MYINCKTLKKSQNTKHVNLNLPELTVQVDLSGNSGKTQLAYPRLKHLQI